MRCLYGRISSINVQKVAWALTEINLDFDWVDKNGTVSSIDSPSYRTINPAAQIPTLDDNGILLRQSQRHRSLSLSLLPGGQVVPN
jgi:glutathione S-transferase